MSGLTRINTNIAALRALQNLNHINTQMAIRQLRLTTGKQLNDPSDNPAGWTIAAKLRTRAAGLGQALDNITSTKDMIAVAEGHLGNIQSIIEEMRIKAEEAANDTLGTSERQAILNQLSDYNNQINMEVQQAQWNGKYLLYGASGTNNSTFEFQIGASTASSDSLTFSIAGEIWGSSSSTTFNSAGLDVTAGTVNSNVQFSGVGTTNNGFAGEAVGTTSVQTSNGFSELSSGNYQIEISASATSSAGSITIRLRDLSTNELVTIGSGTSQGTAISALSLGGTLSSGTLTGVNLGIGIQIGTIQNISSSEAGVVGVTYTESGSSVSNQTNAQSFMDKIDAAINKVSEAMSYTGAIVSRLSYQEISLSTAQTRTEAARSSIEDADMAYEQLEATKLTILQQTATSMLAQANLAPQQVLALFGA